MRSGHLSTDIVEFLSERFVGDPVLPNLLPFCTGHCTDPLLESKLILINKHREGSSVHNILEPISRKELSCGETVGT